MVSEFVEKGFVEEVLDILGVVEGGGGRRGFRGLSLVSRLARVYAFSIIIRSNIPDPSDYLHLPLKIHSLRKSGREI